MIVNATADDTVESLRLQLAQARHELDVLTPLLADRLDLETAINELGDVCACDAKMLAVDVVYRARDILQAGCRRGPVASELWHTSTLWRVWVVVSGGVIVGQALGGNQGMVVGGLVALLFDRLGMATSHTPKCTNPPTVCASPARALACPGGAEAKDGVLGWWRPSGTRVILAMPDDSAEHIGTIGAQVGPHGWVLTLPSHGDKFGRETGVVGQAACDKAALELRWELDGGPVVPALPTEQETGQRR